MSFIIQATAEVVYSCVISDEDEERIRNFIKENPDEFEFMDADKAICYAIEIMGMGDYFDMECIDVYKKSSESDFYTQEYTFDDDDRTAEEILSGAKMGGDVGD